MTDMRAWIKCPVLGVTGAGNKQADICFPTENEAPSGIQERLELLLPGPLREAGRRGVPAVLGSSRCMMRMSNVAASRTSTGRQGMARCRPIQDV